MGARFTFMCFACKCASALVIAGVLLACGTVLELGDGEAGPGTDAGGSVDGIDPPSTCALTVDQQVVNLGDTLTGQSVTTTLRLANASGVPAVVTATLTGPANGGYSVNPPSLTVPAAGAANLAVTFTGNGNGTDGIPPPASLQLAWGASCKLPAIPLIARTVTTAYAIAPGSIDLAARCGEVPPGKAVVIQGLNAGAAWTAVSTPAAAPPFMIGTGAPITVTPTLIPVTAGVLRAEPPVTTTGTITVTVTDTAGSSPVMKTIPVTVTSHGARITFMPANVPVSASAATQVKVLNEGNEPASLLFMRPGFDFFPGNVTVAGGAVGVINVRATGNPTAGPHFVNVSTEGVAPCYKQTLTINYDP